jgi:hypothetical protein
MSRRSPASSSRALRVSRGPFPSSFVQGASVRDHRSAAAAVCEDARVSLFRTHSIRTRCWPPTLASPVLSLLMDREAACLPNMSRAAVFVTELVSMAPVHDDLDRDIRRPLTTQVPELVSKSGCTALSPPANTLAGPRDSSGARKAHLVVSLGNRAAHAAHHPPGRSRRRWARPRTGFPLPIRGITQMYLIMSFASMSPHSRLGRLEIDMGSFVRRRSARLLAQRTTLSTWPGRVDSGSPWTTMGRAGRRHDLTGPSLHPHGAPSGAPVGRVGGAPARGS